MKKNLLHIAFLLIIAFGVLISVAPSHHPVPGRDQGVYLYIGEQILEGSVPYRDIWDHKGPVIYYLNALGLSFGISTYWGVWILEVFSLFVALIFSYLVMAKFFSPESAFFGTGLWLLGLAFVIDGGNTVEEFTLPVQFLTIFLFLRAEKEKKPFRYDFGIGLLAAFAFFTRPNNVGEVLAVGIILGLRILLSAEARKRAFSRLIGIGAGALVLGVIVVGYFWLQDALHEFWRSAFIYNFQYSTVSSKRWDAILKGTNYLSPLVPLGFSAWILGLAYFFLSKEKNAPERDLLKLALLILPIDFALSLTSGRRYLHYFTAWLLPFGLFSGFFAYKFQTSLANADDKQFPAWFKPSKVWIYLLFLSLGFLQLTALLPATQNFIGKAIQARGVPDGGNDISNSPCQYIKENTQPNDYVLIWGNEVECNFVTQRKSPSRFIYLYPLMLKGYLSDEEIEALRKDIAEKKPLIIDTTLDDRMVFSPASERWDEIPDALPLIDFVLENYAEVDQIPDTKWKVWKIK